MKKSFFLLLLFIPVAVFAQLDNHTFEHKTQEFVMLRLLYDLKVADGLTLTARAEPFYDTYAESIEYSFGLYLNFSERFFLLNAKKN